MLFRPWAAATFSGGAATVGLGSGRRCGLRRLPGACRPLSLSEHFSRNAGRRRLKPCRPGLFNGGASCYRCRCWRLRRSTHRHSHELRRHDCQRRKLQLIGVLPLSCWFAGLLQLAAQPAPDRRRRKSLLARPWDSHSWADRSADPPLKGFRATPPRRSRPPAAMPRKALPTCQAAAIHRFSRLAPFATLPAHTAGLPWRRSGGADSTKRRPQHKIGRFQLSPPFRRDSIRLAGYSGQRIS